MAAVQRFKGVSFRLEAAALGSSTAGSQVAAISQKGCFRSTPRLPSVLRIGGIVFEFGDNIKSIDLSVSIVACQQAQQYCGICSNQ